MPKVDTAALRAHLHRANQQFGCAFTSDDFNNADLVTRRGLAVLLNAMPAVLDELDAARARIAELEAALATANAVALDAIRDCEALRGKDGE